VGFTMKKHVRPTSNRKRERREQKGTSYQDEEPLFALGKREGMRRWREDGGKIFVQHRQVSQVVPTWEGLRISYMKERRRIPGKKRT